MSERRRFNPFKQFFVAPLYEPICRYKGVSPGAKVVHARLCRYAGENGRAFPKIDTLAEEVGLSERQTREYLNELRDNGFITWSKQFGGRNVYEFLEHDCFEGYVGQTRMSPSIRQDAAELENSAVFDPSIRQDAAGPIRQDAAGPYKEEEVSIKTHQKQSAPAAQDVDASANNENQNPDARQEGEPQTQVAPDSPQMGASLDGADVDTARAEITGIYRQAKGAKRPKWGTKQGALNLEKLASLIEGLGYDTVIGAIKAYVWDFQPDAPSLKDKPLDWILTSARILSFAGINRTPRHIAPDTPDASAPPRAAPTTPRVSSEPARALDTLLKPASEVRPNPYREVLNAWNEAVPESVQCPTLTTGAKVALDAAMALPEWEKHWRASLAKVRPLLASGKLKFKPTLSWFLRDGWAKLANHDFDWALPEDAQVSAETSGDPDAEPYGVMDRDAIESAITTMIRLPFITPVRNADILDERNHLRKVWDTQGGEAAYRELAYYVRKSMNPAEQSAWFAKLSFVARTRLVEVVEKFKI